MARHMYMYVYMYASCYKNTGTQEQRTQFCERL